MVKQIRQIPGVNSIIINNYAIGINTALCYSSTKIISEAISIIHDIFVM
jgi:hypothetical protein